VVPDKASGPPQRVNATTALSTGGTSSHAYPGSYARCPMAVPLMGAVIVGPWDGATEPKLEHDDRWAEAGRSAARGSSRRWKSAPNEGEN
jgi:hypothetical protein